MLRIICLLIIGILFFNYIPETSEYREDATASVDIQWEEPLQEEIESKTATANSSVASSLPNYTSSKDSSKVESSSEKTTESSSSQKNNSSSTQSQALTYSYVDEYEADYFWDQDVRQETYYDSVSQVTLPYTVVVPHDYNENNEYPVLLYLHGAGYRGNDNRTQLGVIIQSYYVGYKWFNQAIIIAPQCPSNGWWDFGYSSDGTLDAVMRLFDKITDCYSCDDKRYYVTGGSMGGYATWQVAAKYSDIFAAAMPLCGWWNTEDAPLLTDIPIRIIHGTADTTVSPTQSQIMYDAIKKAGGNKVELVLYENYEHDVWRKAMREEETYEWLFSQSK